jgi:predicted house-cleaning NTP pyrophosphatase (Maf/HAM1 superfamily)
MSATIIDLATIKARRAAARAAPDLVVLLAWQILEVMVLDRAAGKKRSEAEYIAMLRNFSILNRRQRR